MRANATSRRVVSRDRRSAAAIADHVAAIADRGYNAPRRPATRER